MGFSGPIENNSILGSLLRWVSGRARYRKCTFAARDLVPINKTREFPYGDNSSITIVRQTRPNTLGAPGLREYEYLQVRVEENVVMSYDDNTMKGKFRDGPWADRLLELRDEKLTA